MACGGRKPPVSCRAAVAVLFGSLFGLVLFAAAARTEAAEPGKKGDPAHGLKVSAQLLSADGKQPLRLSIVADIPPGWHIYSITQKPGGPKRSIIQLKESPQFRLSGSLVAAPPPTVEREKYKEIWPDLDVEEHTGQVAWTAPLEVAAGTDINTLAVEGLIKVFMCSDICVDVTLPFTARIGSAAVAERTTSGVAGPAMTLGVLVMGAPVAGEPIASPPGAKEEKSENAPLQKALPQPTESNLVTPQITITGQLDRKAVAPGETATLTLKFVPARGWHIYPLGDKLPSIGGWPTRVVITDAAGLDVGPSVAPDAIVKEKISENAISEKYYQGPVQVTLPVRVPPQSEAGTYGLTGTIGYQTCDKNGCRRPTGARFFIPVTVGTEARSGNVAALFANASYPPTPQEEAPHEAEVKSPPVEASAAPAALNENFKVAPYGGGSHAGMYGFGFDLLLAFLGGLILNAMPCVLPVVGLKVMSFVQQAGENRGRVFALNAWFSLGLISVFLVWAALVAFFSMAASAQFQRPEFSVTLAAVTFAFALSLLGIWEIPLPGFVGSNAAHQVGEREGATGAVAKGILSTILATPCVGPFIGGTLDWTIGTGSAPRIFAIYAAMGLGMASPYLIIGLNPALLRWLPKPGLWMDTFKQLMGFLLLATVVWIFWFMPSQYFIAALALLFAVWMGCWWIGRTPLTAELGQKLRTWAVAAVIVMAVAVPSFKWLVQEPVANLPSIATTSNSVWRPFSVAAFQELRADGTTVLIDFTAKWCFTCQLNKASALHRQATEDYMREHGMVGLVADKTEDSPEIDKLMTRLEHPSGAIPFYAVFPGQGGPVITYKEGPLLQGTLLGMLKQAGPSRIATKPAGTTVAQPDASMKRESALADPVARGTQGRENSPR